MTSRPVRHGVVVLPIAQRAKWAQQRTEHDALDGTCADCGERLSVRDAEEGFRTCPPCAKERRDSR